jgi:3-oxoacyl-[acyl-carrier-protein] synthase II
MISPKPPFRTNVVVTGIGLRCALGDLETSWQRLLAGESGLRWQQPFPEFPPRPLGAIADRPVNFLTLTQQVVGAALQDAQLTPPLPDCGVVVGSSRSQQGVWEQYRLAERTGEGGYTNGQWLDSLPHMGAIAAARAIGATGTVQAPMAACATGLWAIAQAYELIRTGHCQQAIAGAVETPITPLTLVGFEQMGALAKTGVYPFDRHREGLTLGEGAAVLVLESLESAQQRNAGIYGQVLGVGLTADGYHVCAIDPSGAGSMLAIKHCLDRSGLSFQQVDYIHAHGTGTPLNDRMESQVIGQLFPAGVPVSSTKGATGHTIGASGAIGAAFCLMALRHQTLPPCIGLQEPAFDLDFVTTARSAKVRTVLCLSFGFGGQNTAIALGNLTSETGLTQSLYL